MRAKVEHQQHGDFTRRYSWLAPILQALGQVG